MRNNNDKGKRIIKKMLEVGWDNCYISEYTLAELYYGAYCSKVPEDNLNMIAAFCHDVNVIPISDVLLEFARQKSMLRQMGTPVEDADVFIGSTAVACNMVMVTENIKHIGRLQGIHIENWCE